MNGEYITKNQRTILANQIRSTHFTLGGDAKAFLSTTSNSYQGISGAPSSLNQHSRTNMTREHFILGKSPNSMKTQSQFIAKYKQHPLQQNQHQKQTQADLRRHHFKLGSFKPSFQTSTGDYKPPKGVQGLTKQQRVQQDNKLRKHNFHLGIDPDKLQSTSRQDYQPSKTPVNRDLQMVQLEKELRSTHFQLGLAPKTFLTSHRNDFTGSQSQKALLNKQQKQNLRRGHFQLGNQKGLSISTSRSELNQKQKANSSLNQQQLDNLRKSHFTLGNQSAQYSLSSTLQTGRPSTKQEKPTQSSIKLRQTHFLIGDDHPSWTSVYKANHSNTKPVTSEAKRDKASDRNSNLQLGKEKTQMISMSQKAFKPPINPISGNLNTYQASQLRKTHFRLGTEKPQYSTVSREYGVQKGNPSQFDSGRLRDLQSSHFVVGTNPVSFKTNAQEHYTDKGKGTSAFNKALARDLRRNHFDIGEGEYSWKTEQRTSYRWVQPVPGKMVHFTLDN